MKTVGSSGIGRKNCHLIEKCDHVTAVTAKNRHIYLYKKNRRIYIFFLTRVRDHLNYGHTVTKSENP